MNYMATNACTDGKVMNRLFNRMPPFISAEFTMKKVSLAGKSFCCGRAVNKSAD